LIRVVTLLYQKQRPAFEINNTKFLVSIPQDASTVVTIGGETFKRTSMGLNEPKKSMTWVYRILDSLVDK
jgi:hypothetical protein